VWNIFTLFYWYFNYIKLHMDQYINILNYMYTLKGRLLNEGYATKNNNKMHMKVKKDINDFFIKIIYI